MKQTTKDSAPVLLVGPVLPYRGGIAQHTTMLHRAMREMTDLRTISFSRQYPAWLFPGESDRDPAYEGHRETGVEYLIDSVDPRTWRKAMASIIAHPPRQVIIPWWTIFWTPCFGYLSKRLRAHGIDVIFFCHNVIEHESAAWKQWLTRQVLKNGTRFVVHTQEDATNLRRFLPDAEVAVQPHPIYDQFPTARGKLPRRRALELLFYGFVRPYKGLDILIEAMRVLRRQDVQLTIAGEFWEDEAPVRERITRLGLEDRIELRPHYHTEEETAELFARADVVILPYRSATGSGVVPIAYHYEKPVIVTRVGGLPDVVRDGKTGFIVPPNDPHALADKIGTLTAEMCHDMLPQIRDLKRSLTWERLAEVLLNR